ncbi:hypothetical protein BDZ94DRAFT_1169136 [Collybia nuda]|uniref:DUF3533 domain-containing protein n=1 Tax=Collybia nuda TaxID=64659 RepID=A0A9P5Y1U1_9AGAR|nr:hypothetical protein BDZ94DRAFT_1169136 [Collybia nuda]
MSSSEHKSPRSGSIRSTSPGIHDHRNNEPTPAQFQAFSCQFFDRNEAASKARYIYTKILFFRTCLIIVVMFAVFSIYWGALSSVPARGLQGWIVDFDGGRVGQAITRELSGLSTPAVSWKVRSSQDFPHGTRDLVHAILEEHCWIAVATNPGSTLKLDAALKGVIDPPYNASHAITVYGIEARNENAFRTLIRPNVEMPLQKVTHDFATQLIRELASNSTDTLSSINPEMLVRPIYFTVNNLRPFDIPLATAVTYVGLIYILILSFYVVNSTLLARTASGLERRLTLSSLIRIRVITPVIIYFVLSCFYSIVTLAFKLPFDRKFGRAGFVVFWMLSWFGMTATGLALETMMTLLTVKYIQVFLILWMISNVSVCLWPIDALPRVYMYGHAAPFYQISRGVRTIVFNTKNEVGLNFGILSVWIIISCLSLPLIQWYRRREEVHQVQDRRP